MARRQTLLELLDELTPVVAEAFRQSIQRITDDVVLRDLEDAIRRGDIEGAVSLIRADRGHFRPLEDALASAYGAGGDLTMDALKASASKAGARVTGFFDPHNPRAERFLAEQSSRLITGPMGSIDEIRENVRRRLITGMQRVREGVDGKPYVGTSPREAALDLVGRRNIATGQRQGGVIGLADNQIDWVNDAQDELFSDSPSALKRFKRRAHRDRRFDRMIDKAIAEGRGLDRTEAKKILNLYKARVLRYRGETIARTELLGSLHAAQDEALTQMMEREGLSADAVTQEWDSASDGDTRDSHREADGQQRQKGQPFDVGGYQMQFPGDRSLGAPAEEIINCRCRASIDVDWTSLLGSGD